MNRSGWRIVAGFVLALYVAVAPSIEFFHTDEFVGSGAGPQEVHLPGNATPGLTQHDGVCLACLLASGHFQQETPWVISAAFEYHGVSFQITFPPRITSRVSSARAPPSGFHAS